MAFDFPTSPPIGTISGNYTWDGEKWIPLTTAPPTFADAPNNGLMYGRKSATWQRAVDAAGDTMTGQLTFNAPALFSGASPGAGAFYDAGAFPARFWLGTDFAADTFRLYSSAVGNVLSITGATGQSFFTKDVRLMSASISSNSSTGALVVDGGLGVKGAVNVDGTMRVSHTIDAQLMLEAPGGYAVARWKNPAKVFQVTLDPANNFNIYDETRGAFVLTIYGNNGGFVIPNDSVFSSTNDSTFWTNGALSIHGGLGVGKKVNANGGMYIASDAAGATALEVHGPVGTVGMYLGFSGVSSSYYDADYHHFRMGGGTLLLDISPTNVNVAMATASTLPSNGALTVAGGAGISGDLRVAGNAFFSYTVTAGVLRSDTAVIATTGDLSMETVGRQLNFATGLGIGSNLTPSLNPGDTGTLFYSSTGLAYVRDNGGSGVALILYDGGGTYIVYQTGTSFSLTDTGAGSNKIWVKGYPDSGQFVNRFTAARTMMGISLGQGSHT